MTATETTGLDLIIQGDHPDPFAFLGMQVSEDAASNIVVRAFVPEAEQLWVVEAGKPDTSLPMHNVHDGFFEVVMHNRHDRFPYRLRAANARGDTWEFHDPYSFPPLLSDYDLHLLKEGTHYRNYEKLGSHVRVIDGVRGVHFAVWAPNAKRVSLIGDFNHWNGLRHPMRFHPGAGIWEIFIPGLGEETLYKFEIKWRRFGFKVQKTDPYAFYFERRPKTAAIVYDINKYQWRDENWMRGRAAKNGLDAPMSIYEVHLGSWMRAPEEGDRYLTYRELAHKLVDYVKQLGYTHIELLPVTEHPYDGSWGYQTVGYFAPTSRHGEPDEFMYFVDYCHRNGVGVILDWVPAHFPKDGHGLAYFDGTHLYEHSDPRKGEHQDWGTLIFNYARNEVRNYLLGNALFWLEKYHIDGLRVDAVASMLYLDYSRKEGQWLPNIHGGRENLEAIDFIKKFNELVHQQHPGAITFAEESTSWPLVSRPTYDGGLGFDFKWNMGWMNDTLTYFKEDSINRKYHHGKLTFSLMYAFSENFVLPLSHDEVVYGKKSIAGKMPGDLWQQMANLRLLYGWMWTHPGKKLLFMGSEFGQWREWNHDRQLDWWLTDQPEHKGVMLWLRDLNRAYREQPALFEQDFVAAGFQWIDGNDYDQSIVTFLRWPESGPPVLVACNFTPVPREGYRVGVPMGGAWREILNSDSATYGGSGVGNMGRVHAHDTPWHGRSHSVCLTLPPLSMVAFTPERAQ